MFVATVAVFLLIGPRAGFRFVGLIGAVGSVELLRAGRVSAGIEGYEPSFYVTGRAAAVIGVVTLLLFVMMIVIPDAFVRFVS